MQPSFRKIHGYLSSLFLAHIAFRRILLYVLLFLIFSLLRSKIPHTILDVRIIMYVYLYISIYPYIYNVRIYSMRVCVEVCVDC